MVWMGGGGYRLAGSLVELWHQLTAAYPSSGWQNSPDTGTIGDASHQAQGESSDHNPWLHNTVRALDVANSDPAGPDCEALFQMVNRMYAAKDTRVYPNGYAIYRGRITDWSNPGGYHAQQGDPHTNHVHISVSQNPAGYDSATPWPLAGVAPVSGPVTPIYPPNPQQGDDVSELVRYVGAGIKNTGATYLSTGRVVQRYIDDPKELDDLRAWLASKGLPNAVTPTQHSRPYFGVLVGPKDPEA